MSLLLVNEILKKEYGISVYQLNLHPRMRGLCGPRKTLSGVYSVITFFYYILPLSFVFFTIHAREVLSFWGPCGPRRLQSHPADEG